MAEIHHVFELARHSEDSRKQIERLGEGISRLSQRASSPADDFKSLKARKSRDADMAELLSGFGIAVGASMEADGNRAERRIGSISPSTAIPRWNWTINKSILAFSTASLTVVCRGMPILCRAGAAPSSREHSTPPECRQFPRSTRRDRQEPGR